MKTKDVKNIAASVRARLLIKAKQFRLDYNRMLLLYVQERFLYRLSGSEYRTQLILKGGILFYGAHREKARTTKDIDLLAAKIPNNEAFILKCFQNIFSIEAEDGVQFLDDTIKIEKIAEDAVYEGSRLKFHAKLETAIIPIQIDIGFSDKIFPHPVRFEYPVLLTNEPITVMAYSWESIIAEKFEAIIKLGQLNSRMKDFYDIYFIQRHQDFNGEILSSAVDLTFKYRKTDISSCGECFSETFMNDPNKQKQWQAFQSKVELATAISFEYVIKTIKNFLSAVVEAISNNDKLASKWDCHLQMWINE